MSENQNNNQDNKQTGEVDLIVFFDYIGNLFNKLLQTVKDVLTFILSSIIFVLKSLFINWKLVAGILIVAACLGFALQKYETKEFASSMLIEPKFDSKYQLVGNINYYNALLENNNREILKKIFKINEETLETLHGFKIEKGPETENDRVLEFQRFYKQLDTVSKLKITYDEYLENRSMYSGRVFKISAFASKAGGFKKFEEGLLTSFSNSYTKKIKKRRDTLLSIKISSLKDQIKQLDSLQLVYIDVIKKESESSKISFANGDIPLIAQKQNTREYDILEKELILRNQLRVLEEQRVEEAVFYDVISSFQEVGNQVISWKKRYMIIFPILAFLLLILGFFSELIIKYTLNYEK